MRSSGQHLLALVNEILDLSKAESGKIDLRLEDLALRDLLEAACELVRPLASAKTHSLSLRVEDGLERIRHDPVRLRQIGLNLLSNAVKFTPANGTISVAARRMGTTASRSRWRTADRIAREIQSGAEAAAPA